MNKEVETLKGEKIPIMKFNLENCVEHPSIVLIAKRGSGKSWLVRTILKHFHSIPMGIIISRTERMDPFYSKFFPDSFIYYEYKTSIIEKLLARQLKIKEKNQSRIANGKKPIDTRAFIVMDDCLSQKGEWAKDKVIKELLFEGRHYDIMYILTMQYPLGIVPELRSNFDYIFVLSEDFHTNIKKIFDHYAGMFPNLETFKQVFTQLTENYCAMVIVNRGKRLKFQDKIFWFSSPDSDGNMQKIGNEEFNRFHEINYDPNWKLKYNKHLFTTNLIKKNQTKYNVQKLH